MRIQGLQKLTLLDFPEHVACTVFTAGCNFRCPFCHNASLVVDIPKEAELTEEKFFEFLEKRKGVLDGVCVSGGEPLLQHGIENFIRKIKEMGYAVKLDTNGSFPEKLRFLVEEKLIDYVAMDNKMPSTRTWTLPGGAKLFDRFSLSLQALEASGLPYEIRTTVHPGLLEESDLLQMIRECEQLGYRGTYYLQYFFNAGPTLGNLEPPTRRYDRPLLDKYAPLRIGYRNFPEDRGKN